MPSGPPARRVLLVEDEAAIRELLRLHLSLAGFDIEEVGDGRTALERVRASRFDPGGHPPRLQFRKPSADGLWKT